MKYSGTVMRQSGDQDAWAERARADAGHGVVQIHQLAAVCLSGAELAQRAMDVAVNVCRSVESGVSDIVLARCFVTGQAEALGVSGERTAPHLVLVASAGEAAQWADAVCSGRSGGVPMTRPQFVTQFPMLADLLDQVRLAAKTGEGVFLRDRQSVSRRCTVMTVPMAKGHPYLAEYEDFVDRYAIRSVVGCSGVCPDGQGCVTVFWLRASASEDMVECLRLLMEALHLAWGTMTEHLARPARHVDTARLEEWVEVYGKTIDAQGRSLRKTEERMHQLAKQIVTVQEGERARIARELHDHVVSRLAGIGFTLHAVVQVPPQTNEELLGALREILVEIDGLGASARSLAFRLHPVVLSRLGLSSSLHRLMDECERQKGVRITRSVCELRQPLASLVAVVLYRVAEEALQNIVKHAGVQDCVVTLGVQEGELELCVADRGRGFAMSQSHVGCAGLGLLSMAERVRQIHGRLVIQSAPGEGTMVIVRVALPDGDGIGRDDAGRIVR